MKKKNYIIGFILLALLLASPLLAQRTILHDNSQQQFQLTYDAIYILEDKNRSYEFKDVLSGRYDGSFKENRQKTPNWSYTRSAFWLKFKIHNPDSKARNRYLEVGYALIDYLEFYFPDENGHYHVEKSGQLIPFNNRKIKYRHFVFQFDLHPQKTSTYYLRVESRDSLNTPITVYTKQEFMDVSIRTQFYLGLMYGFIIIIILYNFFIYLSIKDTSYLYLFIYMIFLVVYIMSENGIASQFLWPSFPRISKLSVPLTVNSVTFWSSLFVTQFLQTKKNIPVIHTVIRVFTMLSLIVFILVFFMPYSYCIVISVLLILFYAPAIIFAGLVSWRNGYRPAVFFLIGWSALSLGAFLYAIKTFGLAPENLLTKHGVLIGALIQVAILSAALGDRLRIMKEEKELAQQEAFRMQKMTTQSLEEKVRERTSELNAAYEKLKEMDKLKSRFFSNISHEIRTPLTLILSPVEAVLQGGYEGRVDEEFFISLQRNSIKLLKLINSLLDFSKIEAGQMKVKVQKADIVNFINNYISTIEATARTRGISVLLRTEVEHVDNFYFDLEKMDKILMNIFSNALKFTDDGGTITAVISATETACIIEITDTGAGIPEDKVDSIFDRFAQVDATSTRKYEGTGIGLALVKEFVDLHHGSVTVNSRHVNNFPHDHGTTFRLMFPKGAEHFKEMDNVEYPLDETASSDSIVLEDEKRRFSGMRELDDLKKISPARDNSPVAPERPERYTVLIVEDNDDMRNFITFILDSEFYTCTATNGREGLETARSVHPDLIISDVMMPEMNGYELVQHIKNSMDLENTPVILLTAKAEAANKIEGIEFGADDYLTKPFNSRELIARVRSQLKNYEYQKIITRRNSEIEQELETARLIQARLLPDINMDDSGFLISTRFLPMDKVGGDFYEFHQDDKHIKLFLADVSGHGIPGAFLALITKLLFQNLIQSESGAGEVLKKLNNVLVDYTVKSNFVTSFFISIDRTTRLMTYTCAGHVPPVLYRRSTDEIIYLNTRGIPLGWFSGAVFEQETIELEQGDRIFLYTDGVTEAVNSERKMFGDARLQQYIQKVPELDIEDFSERLIEEIKNFTGSDEFQDDLTFIVLDVL